MKKKDDPRHEARVNAVKVLFAFNFQSGVKLDKTSIAYGVVSKKGSLDKIIAENAPLWPLAQINPIDLAVLRVAVWELLFKKPKEPYKVVIDEAVEIAKEYGAVASGSFVNGVLGAIMKKYD